MQILIASQILLLVVMVYCFYALFRDRGRDSAKIKRAIELGEAVYGEHVICAACLLSGHKQDMIREGEGIVQFFHRDCYAKKFNKHQCECGKGWVDGPKEDYKNMYETQLKEIFHLYRVIGEYQQAKNRKAKK